jgi:hypothetical protein
LNNKRLASSVKDLSEQSDLNHNSNLTGLINNSLGKTLGKTQIPEKPIQSLTIEKPPMIFREKINSRSTETLLSDMLDKNKSIKKLYCKAVKNYNGSPEPPINHPLVFEQDEIIQVTNFADAEWFAGVKFLFNGSPLFENFYRVEGFFPKKAIEIINTKQTLDIYSWYLSDCSREKAEEILDKITYHTCFKNVFVVRSKNNTDFAISIAYLEKKVHFKIHEQYFGANCLVEDVRNGGFLQKDFNQKNESNVIFKYFSLEKRYFLSIVELVEFYKKNKFNNFENLGVSYREAIPKPIGIALALDNFYLEANKSEINLNRSEKCFIAKIDDKNEKCLIFNVQGLMDYIPLKCLQIIQDFRKAS